MQLCEEARPSSNAWSRGNFMMEEGHSGFGDGKQYLLFYVKGG
jgi:hypothetical protein